MQQSYNDCAYIVLKVDKDIYVWLSVTASVISIMLLADYSMGGCLYDGLNWCLSAFPAQGRAITITVYFFEIIPFVYLCTNT